MDGRGRQGSNNSGAPASAPPLIMSNYGYPGSETNSSIGSAYSPRDRFWSAPSSATTPEPWRTGPYTPQLDHSNFPNPNQNSPDSHSYIPYGGHNSQANGGPSSMHNNNAGDLTFSGPSPPNQLQPISVSSSPYPPPSPRRQYTPSTTPSPHVGSHSHQSNMQQSPTMNGNGINGNSNHSSGSSAGGSPPNNPRSGGGNSGPGGSFQTYLNGETHHHHHHPQNNSGSMQNGHSAMLMSSKNNGPNANQIDGATGHPNELPGYLSHPRQSLHSSSGRYPGEIKASSDGDSMMQQQQQYQQQHQQYYQNYGSYPSPYYQDNAGYQRPYDPYQPYGSGSSASSAYPSITPGYHSEYGSTAAGSNSGSANDQGKSSVDLLGDNGSSGSRKIDSTRESMQHTGKPPGNSHESGNFSSSENIESNSGGGGGSTFENTLMNLNNPSHGHHPQDSSSCSSQSPSSFDLHYSSGQQQHQNQGGLGYSHNIKGTSPSTKSDDSNNNNEKMKSPSSYASASTTDYNNTPEGSKLEGMGSGSFLGVGHSQSPNQYQQLNSGGSPKQGLDKQRKLSNSTSPNSEGGDRDRSSSQQQAEDIKPVINVKPPPAPAKKKRKKKAPNKNAADSDKGKEQGNSIKIKEEPKDSSSASEYGKLNKLSKLEEDRRAAECDDDDMDDDMKIGGDDDDVRKDKKDVPMVECGCFPADEVHAEPGPFYTHLGAAHNLPGLRELIENRTGFRGNQLRLEKVIYTGKEGKTSHGCPLSKWILRRGSFDEQLLFLVKHRKGHKCATAWIVVCCVIWDGVPSHFADNLYDTLVYKLNRFGIPTTRRSDTNEQRSCACQGVDPDTCGAAFSFGCAWSMFFNGCKYARSRNVRKFRLTEEHEESELEEKVQHLASHLGPLYERVAPDSYTNQIDHENEGLECRLGYRPGRPFSGVTACLDYCSHAHKDAHNMMNGCTVTVSLTRNRTMSKGDDEQFHVLPLYKLDDSDEHGSKEGQKQKVKKGQLEILKKYPCKVRIRKVPLLPSRRRAKAKASSSSSSAATKSENAASTPIGSSVGGMSSPLSSPTTSAISSLKSPGDFSNSDIPPIKREKLFEDRRPNGTTGVSGSRGETFGDIRFHPAYTGISHHGSSHHAFGTDLGPGSVSSNSSTSLWNHFGTSGGSPSSLSSGPSGSQSLSHHGSLASQQSGANTSSSFRSYFDHPFASSGTSSGPSTAGSSAGPFGHSSSLANGSSSISSLTELTNSTSMSRHGSSSNLTNLGTSAAAGGGGSSSNLLGSPGSSGGNPGSASSGYSSMSPILPSFRNTFMTEAESLSMLNSLSSPSAPDSTSSPRSHGKSNNAGASHHSSASSNPLGSSMSSPAFTDPTSSYPYSSASDGYHPGQSLGPPGGIYHPHPHNPCLPPPTGLGGVPTFPSSSLLGSSSYGAGAGAGSTFGHPESHYGMNMNPLNSWSSGYSTNYAAAAAYNSYSQPMGSMGVGMTPPNFGHPMNQYSPYQNPMHQQQMSNSWATPPINPFAPGNMGLNMHHPHHPPPPPPSCFVTPPKPKVIPEVNESFSDNEDCFKDPQMGGVAIALSHGSVILQCAKHEMHATTALKSPNRMYPSRICLIFYQHKSMNNRFHGWSEWEKKIEAKKLQEVKLINQGKMEASPRKMKQLIKEGYIMDNP